MFDGRRPPELAIDVEEMSCRIRWGIGRARELVIRTQRLMQNPEGERTLVARDPAQH